VGALLDRANLLRPEGSASGEIAALSGEKLVAAQSELLSKVAHTANTDDADFARAMLLFDAAHALYPRPNTLISAGNMALKLGDCALAAEIYRRVLAHPREPQKKSSGLGRALSPSRGRGDRSPTRFPLRPEHAALAEKKLAEAEKMVASFGEMLADMEADLAQAEGRAADAAARAARLKDDVAAGGAKAPPVPTEPALQVLQHEHARALVAQSCAARSKEILSGLPTPLDPPGLAAAARLALDDLRLERDYFGPALDKAAPPAPNQRGAYPAKYGAAYLTALELRSQLLLDAAASCLSRLRHGSDPTASAQSNLEAYEEWAAVWPVRAAAASDLAARRGWLRTAGASPHRCSPSTTACCGTRGCLRSSSGPA
jgi:hypothetical protein